MMTATANRPDVGEPVCPCPPWCARPDCDGAFHESARTPIGGGEMFGVLEPDPVTGEWRATLRTDGEIAVGADDLATLRALGDAYLTAA